MSDKESWRNRPSFVAIDAASGHRTAEVAYVESFARNLWCSALALGCGGFVGMRTGQMSPLFTDICFGLLMIVSAAQVMRHDNRSETAKAGD